MVKLGTVASQKKLFFSLRSIKSRLNILDAGELTPDQAKQLSDKMNISADEITKMNQRLSSRDLSLNAPLSTDDEGMEFQDTLVAEGPSPERLVADAEELSHHGAILRRAMQALPERDRDILAERRLNDEPKTLDTLGQKYGISRERVRQLEVRAFEKVQEAVKTAVAQEATA
jgi:RNA polymerase sigma-32 factor